MNPRIPASRILRTGGPMLAGASALAVPAALAGLYIILLRVPAHTRIAPHSPPDDRVATVVSGTWYFGYGREFVADSLHALPPGSFYTEPPGDEHFAETRDSEVIVQITGFGPTGTTYVHTEDAPPR